MLTRLPSELLYVVLGFLGFQDLETLLKISPIETVVRHCLLRRFRFQYQVSSVLRLYECMAAQERQSQATRHGLANQLLDLICHSVEKCPRLEQRSQFSDHLSSLEKWVVRRVLLEDLQPGLEYDYADLCLDIRYMYLNRPTTRMLHDPKYRRRSTKYPLAPFLPREFTFIWRRQCTQVQDTLFSKRRVMARWTGLVAAAAAGAPLPGIMDDPVIVQRRKIRLRFARFFGKLFKVTSLYLESNLNGTFEECVREALVAGDVESLVVMCDAAGRPVDVETMCMMVSTAAEQLWRYLDTMGGLMVANLTPGQSARMEATQGTAGVVAETGDVLEDTSPPPDWLMPHRYRIHDDTRLRLKLLNHLHQQGWCWF